MNDIKIIISKKRYPGLRKRLLWKLFPNFMRVGWMWYHSVFSERLLKKFNKHFIPWTYTHTIENRDIGVN